jgi:predicted short-subunit dehydrogenase-like oxidoreductase (DUF2520 family)
MVTADEPLGRAPLRCAVVGGGRVGAVLVASLAGAVGPFGRGFEGDDHDVVVLAVPDREIERAAAAISPRPGRVVGHCSGATPLTVLAPHEAFGLHPLMTVPGVAAPARALHGAPAAIAGTTPHALAVARALADELEMRPFAIDDHDRATYHAAASIASNFLVTIEDAAEELLRAIGLERSILVPIVGQTVANWAEVGRDALTGPVRRGDDATVARQRDAIAGTAPDLLALFDVLVARTRAISRPEQAS